MIEALNNYDWEEVFGEGTGGNCGPIIPDTVPPGSAVSITTFGREDVVEIGGMVEGENDGPDWVIWGRLNDGRWFSIRAGCDYTGWNCRAGNSGNVANTRDEIIAFGLSNEERERLNLTGPVGA